MKTKNNVQKTILNTFAVLTSVILLSFSVNAQSFWKTILENNSFNEIAMVMVDSKSESAFSGGSSNHSNFADFMVNESEESLELESWMTDDSYFDSNTFYMEKETDDALELESWMTEEAYFEADAFEVEEEMDNNLELEDWMLDYNLFEGNEIQNTVETDQELELESWMVSKEVWVG